MDHGSWIMDHGSWIMDHGSWIMDHSVSRTWRSSHTRRVASSWPERSAGVSGWCFVHASNALTRDDR
ncbi:MAG: hypothetical protein EOP87_18145 [Verrucomicrobiaceae bacterium]|nr:MAG: hypothetical protein EOP87_18145 [Verrucomicrobiaceae bacterium]